MFSVFFKHLEFKPSWDFGLMRSPFGQSLWKRFIRFCSRRCVRRPLIWATFAVFLAQATVWTGGLRETTRPFHSAQFGKDLQNYFGRFLKKSDDGKKKSPSTWDVVICFFGFDNMHNKKKTTTSDVVIFEYFFLWQVWRTCSFVGPTGEVLSSASRRTESPKLGGLTAKS